jgi:hypothetical protein
MRTVLALIPELQQIIDENNKRHLIVTLTIIAITLIAIICVNKWIVKK